MMLRQAGYAWIAVSIVHGIAGIALYPHQWQEIIRDGFFNSVSPNPLMPVFDREAAFWIEFLTPFIFLIGQFCLWLDRHQLNPPRSFSLILLGTVLVGLFLMPISGFWLALIPTLMMLYASKSTQLSTEDRS